MAEWLLELAQLPGFEVVGACLEPCVMRMPRGWVFAAHLSAGGQRLPLGSLGKISSSPRKLALPLAQAHLLSGSWKGQPKPGVCKPHRSCGAPFANEPLPANPIWKTDHSRRGLAQAGLRAQGVSSHLGPPRLRTFSRILIL